MPGKLWIKADQGFKRTPVYRKPFTYKVDSTGITTIQNAQTGHLKWAQVEKVIDSQLCLYVYINKKKNENITVCSVFGNCNFDWKIGVYSIN